MGLTGNFERFVWRRGEKTTLFLSLIHLYWPALECISDLQGVPKIA
jgi:hypothetical protein